MFTVTDCGCTRVEGVGTLCVAERRGAAPVKRCTLKHGRARLKSGGSVRIKVLSTLRVCDHRSGGWFVSEG